MFDSNAILLYLAEKTGQFLPRGGLKAKAELLSWLMFTATGIGLWPRRWERRNFSRDLCERLREVKARLWAEHGKGGRRKLLYNEDSCDLGYDHSSLILPPCAAVCGPPAAVSHVLLVAG